MNDRRVVAACQARCGTVVGGRWTLERLLGTGGMAAVYVGVHTIGRRDAIKILHAHVAAMPELQQRFELEARAVNQFHHPGAVEIRDLGRTDDGCPFLVMELLDGENLRERLDRLGDIANEDLLRYVDDLLDVLAAAHARGIVHRDIKLENLVVTREGRLKLVDFGIARVETQKPITVVGDLIGTLPYMAPEQVSGEGIDGRTDLFAVGVTMFRILAKRRIHESSSHASMILAMGTEAAPTLRSVAPGVDPALAAVVDRALRFRPAERFQSAAEMQVAIRALRARQQPPPLTAQRAVSIPTPVQPSRGARPSSNTSLRRTVAVLSALVLALSGVVVWLLLRAPSRDTAADEAGSATPRSSRKPTSPSPSATPTGPATFGSPSPSPSPPSPGAIDFFGNDVLTVPGALKARFGASTRVRNIYLFADHGSVDVVRDAEHFETYWVNAEPGSKQLRFEESARHSGAAIWVSAGAFGLDELDWSAVPRTVADARGRVRGGAQLTHVVFSRRIGSGSQPVEIKVHAGDGSFFRYDARGGFVAGSG